MGGRCSRCRNQMDRLYVRQGGKRLCHHCIDLETESSHSGRGSYRSSRPKVAPRNQPAPLQGKWNRAEPCVHCGENAYPRYAFLGKEIAACGWGCAGAWMDREMERVLGPIEDAYLAEGVAYVRRSLGLA